MTGTAVRDQRAGCGDEGRVDASLAAGLTAAGLAVTGLAELLAVITRSVALLGDAIHNLSDGPTSRWCFRASDLEAARIPQSSVRVWARGEPGRARRRAGGLARRNCRYVARAAMRASVTADRTRRDRRAVMRFRMIYWRLFRRPRLVTSRLSGPRSPAMSARPASRDTSGPAAVAPADQDHCGSLRLLVAAALLRRGDDIGRVAALTSVPVALLELVRDEHGDQGTGGQPAVGTGGISDPRRGMQDDRIGQQLELCRRRQARARHAIIVLVVTEVAAVASIVAGLAALIWHSTGLAALAGVAAALMFAVFLATRLLARRRGPGQLRGTDTMSSPRPPDDPSRKPSL